MNNPVRECAGVRGSALARSSVCAVRECANALIYKARTRTHAYAPSNPTPKNRSVRGPRTQPINRKCGKRPPNDHPNDGPRAAAQHPHNCHECGKRIGKQRLHSLINNTHVLCSRCIDHRHLHVKYCPDCPITWHEHVRPRPAARHPSRRLVRAHRIDAERQP